jgi:hypothetical protein
MYPVQFDAKPNEHVDRVLKVVVDKDKQSTTDDYLSSIDEALRSQEDLSKLLPQDHPEPVIRGFLGEVAKALRARPKGQP